MKKLVLSQYKVKVGEQPMKNENGDVMSVQPVFINYDVVTSIINILLDARSQQLNAKELLERNMLGEKLIEADRKKEAFVLLLPQEHETLVTAFNTFKGLGQNEVEMVKRIMNAPEVSVTEKV